MRLTFQALWERLCGVDDHPKRRPLVVREPTISYGSHWHGELRTGTDLRRWRKQVGLYQKELAKLLGVTPPTLRTSGAKRFAQLTSHLWSGAFTTKSLGGELTCRKSQKVASTVVVRRRHNVNKEK